MSLSRPIVQFVLAVFLLGTSHVARVIAQSQTDETTPRTGEIKGRVLNEAGQPVAHALVFVTGQGLGQMTTTTDEGGNFVVSGLDPSLYFVGAAAPTYVPPTLDPDNAMEKRYRIGDSVTVNLVKGGVVTGSVTSATGQPLVQAIVRATAVRDENGKSIPNVRFPRETTTDDRGIYRLYGLPAGTYLISAGGRIAFGYNSGAYDSDAPTYAPSSARDTAAEIDVKGGQETSGVDIRYRGEPGRLISGAVAGTLPANSFTSITLSQTVNNISQLVAVSYQAPNSKGFAFYGVADGDYELGAQSPAAQGEALASEALRVAIRGRDVTGLSLVLNAMPSVSGRVVLESSSAIECQNKRKPLYAETLLVARRTEKSPQKNVLTFPNFSVAQTSPDKNWDFAMRSLTPGEFTLNARFFAKYWFLRSIERDPATIPSGKIPATRANDLAKNGFQVKFGDRLTKVTVTLAEGAASIRGAVKSTANLALPKLSVHLVPAEKESAEDVLRFFSAAVQDGSFSLNNLPPGRYWVLVRAGESLRDEKLRAAAEADTRLQLRRDAEAIKQQLELKPCQNLVDYSLPWKNAATKN
jgi:hypothetical protein